MRGGRHPDPTRSVSRRRGCLLSVALLCIGVVLLALVALFLVHRVDMLFSPVTPLTSRSGDTKIRKELVVPGGVECRQEVVVIDVKGVIASGMPFEGADARTIVSQLNAARRDDAVVAVILDMNTPGGEVTASDEIHQAIQVVRQEGKPVVTCMRALGASGGYLVAAGTDYIVANRLTLTGSVGVIIGALNYADLFARYGLESEIYKSGELKDLLHGGRKRTEVERELVQGLIDANFRAFAQIVADGRESYGDAEHVLEAEFADGRVLTGQQALEAGLLDELGYFDDAVAKAREFADAPHARVVRYRRTLRLTDLLIALEGRTTSGFRELLPAEVAHVKPGRIYFLMSSIEP